jgi:DNA-binding LacI/PurR family transcriptional regulator
LVFVDQAPASGITSVNIDDRAGARAAAAHVVELGHRRVGLVTSGFGGHYGLLADPLAGVTGHVERQRMLGWLDALEATSTAHVAVRRPHADPFETGQAAAKVLLAEEPRPTAVLCFSDAIALGVIQTVQAAGLRVPDDLSVVGFDDSPLGRRSAPALTTVSQDAYAKGRTAADALATLIERTGSNAKRRARHLVLPTELLVRDSSARPAH